MKSAIIVDSTAYLPDELACHSDIYQVNLTITFKDGTVFEDSNDLNNLRNYLQEMKQRDDFPQTSQPSIGEYEAIYQQIIAEGYETVYCIHLSSGISGTCQTANLLANKFSDQIKSYVIDSKATSLVIELLVRQCLKMIEEGNLPEDIATTLQSMADQAEIYVMVETTENLVKSGRLNKNLAKIGNILKIVPILSFNDEGKLGLFEKVRTKKRAYKRLLEIIRSSFDKFPDGFILGFAHADDLEEIEAFIELIKKEIPEYQGAFYISILGPVLASHGAAKSKGFGIFPKI